MHINYMIPKDFSINEVAKFKDDIYGKIGGEPLELTIDFTDCEFIDSTGLGAIVSVFKRLNEKSGSLTLRHMNPEIRNLFHMTRLDSVMNIE